MKKIGAKIFIQNTNLVFGKEKSNKSTYCKSIETNYLIAF